MIEPPDSSVDALTAKLQKLADRFVSRVDQLVKVPRYVEKDPHLAQRGDTLCISIDALMQKDPRAFRDFTSESSPLGLIQVALNNHHEAKFVIAGAMELLNGPFTAYHDMLLNTAATSLASIISEKAAGRKLIQYARLPMPLPGCGAMAVHAETDKLLLRMVMGYSPTTLNNFFAADVLYGVI